jgi:hypothetical protein
MRWLVLPILMMVTACATDSPYRDRSALFLSGVEAKALAANTYEISSYGAGQDRVELLALWAMRKAAETTLTQGKAHFRIDRVNLASTQTSVAGMGATLPVVRLAITLLDAPAAQAGNYDAAALKADILSADTSAIPNRLLPVAAT